MSDEESPHPLVNKHSTAPWGWVHLGLSIGTAGLWLPVWLFLWLREAAFKTLGMALGAMITAVVTLLKRPVRWLVRSVRARLGSGLHLP